MNYNKPMIDLVREIRRRAPSEEKPGIKLANPELLEDLIQIYHKSSDNILKALSRELMNMAGEPWPELLQEGLPDSGEQKTHFVTKVYRGQTQLVEKPTESTEKDSRRPVKIYRGQVVAG